MKITESRNKREGGIAHKKKVRANLERLKKKNAALDGAYHALNRELKERLYEAEQRFEQQTAHILARNQHLLQLLSDKAAIARPTIIIQAEKMHHDIVRHDATASDHDAQASHQGQS
jgi:phosphoenolpyruvate-protein kinase (PTS system EI component)